MSNLFDLTGKCAVVVGGAGGIGQAIAAGLASSGAKVMIASRKEESLQRAQREIKEQTGADVLYQTCDADIEPEIVALRDGAVKEMGKVDILVCSQGFNRKHSLVDFNMDDWDAMFQTNVRGVMLCTKIFGKMMKENGYGKITIISSVRALIATYPMTGNAGYCATKGAVNMLIRQAASELAPEVTVNGIGPTVTLTPMMKNIVPKEAVEKSIPADHPMARMAQPEDCVGAAIYFSSSASSYCTGQILYPDGGLTMKG